MFIIIFIIGILIGAIGIFLCFKNKLHTVRVLDARTLELNLKLKQDNSELNKTFEELTEKTKQASNNFKQMSE